MGDAPGPAWQGSPSGLQLGSLLVSFQRFQRPVERSMLRAPASLGALPVAVARQGERRFVLPLADDEAFWIGCLDGSGGMPQLRIEATSLQGQVRLLALTSESNFIVHGLPGDDVGFEPLGRWNLSSVSVTASARRAKVELADREHFVALTGCSPPDALDPSAGYGGWRLP